MLVRLSPFFILLATSEDDAVPSWRQLPIPKICCSPLMKLIGLELTTTHARTHTHTQKKKKKKFPSLPLYFCYFYLFICLFVYLLIYLLVVPFVEHLRAIGRIASTYPFAFSIAPFEKAFDRQLGHTWRRSLMFPPGPV